MTKAFYVKTKMGNQDEITVKGRVFIWNSVWKTYNSQDTNELLTWKMVLEAMK